MASDTDPKDGKNEHSIPGDDAFPGYPHYSGKEDIYRREKQEKEIDPETLNQKENPQKLGDRSMDVPGTDPVDTGVFAQEIINEDEENDYFSLGGDNHHDLEENTETESE